MGEEIGLRHSIEELLRYWQEQNIVSQGVTAADIHKAEKRLGIKLPSDIIRLYERANGMETLYPNYTDKEGFLFHPIQELTTFDHEFRHEGNEGALNGSRCIIFLNYLQRSWYYGILIKPDRPDEYEIIIIPDASRYKTICASISEFIRIYISNSELLYEY
jgi:hypothetical protein